LCATKGRTELLDELLDGASDGDVDCAGVDGETGLMRAAADGDESAVGALLAKRADPNAFDRDRHTALMRAAFHGHAKIIALLCAAGAAVDALDAAGCSALHHAGRGSQEFVFDLLELKHGGDSTLRNAKGEVPEVQDEPCRVQ
jgi:ankyrin repeat protein